MKKLIALFFLLASLHTIAQEDEKNIIIRKASETYKYIKGNGTSPVKVRQDLQAEYLCTSYRTAIQIAEFYDGETDIDDVTIRLDGNKVKYITPKYEYYEDDGIFFSDLHVCHFRLPFEKKNSSGEVNFTKTIRDPRYFTSIYFTEGYPVQQKEITVVIPKWMKVELREFNFKGYNITSRVEHKSDEDIHYYTITDAPARLREKRAPGSSYTEPHLLVLTKWAEPSGTRITYFNTLADQYGWYRSLVKSIGNEVAPVKAKAEEITRGIQGDTEKVKAIFQWVQDNIRYIAYEDGIAGFKPEKAQEVLRKKYGDCKGMGNLTAEMLKSIGLDGRICWLGTHHIAYDYSTPSLGVDNHMIAAWIQNGKTHYLDATEKYIGFGEMAERIQGRQVLVEDGDKFLLQTIPTSPVQQNTSFEKRTLSLDGNDLKGHVVQTWKGENKEWLLSNLHDMKLERQEDALKQYLAEGNNNFQISNMKIHNLENYNADLKIEYDLLFRNAVTSFDKEQYLDLDNRKDFYQFRFDTTKRKLPYQFMFKDHVVFETELELPASVKVSALPQPLKISRAGYDMTGSWSVSNNKLLYRREIQLKKTLLGLTQFGQWNDDIRKLDDFYGTQITLTK